MPRRARQNIISPGTIYHIVCRGNGERKIFWRKRDYSKLIKIIAKTKLQYPFYLYTYNLLPNHYHLEIEARAIPISKIMHQINNSYVKYFNRSYHNSGHLFQDRFFSNVVSRSRYLWEVTRYIDLNAVRAGLVKNPRDYLWSSFSVYLQKNFSNRLIDRDRFLKYGGENLEDVRISYLEFINEALKVEDYTPKFPLKEKMT